MKNDVMQKLEGMQCVGVVPAHQRLPDRERQLPLPRVPAQAPGLCQHQLCTAAAAERMEPRPPHSLCVRSFQPSCWPDSSPAVLLKHF